MIEKIQFGRTGHASTRTLFGAAALWSCSQDEADIEAREQGLVRFLGVTGHDVAIAGMLLKSLQRYHFSSVLLPYNPTMMQNEVYAKGFGELTAVCQKRNVAMQTIKSLSRGPWGDKPRTHRFNPATNQNDISEKMASITMEPLFV